MLSLTEVCSQDSTKMEDWIVLIIKGGVSGGNKEKEEQRKQYFKILPLNSYFSAETQLSLSLSKPGGISEAELLWGF